MFHFRKVSAVSLLLLTLFLMIVGMALSAKNKNGTEYGRTTIYTNDVVASYSLVGNVLGIVIVVIGIVIAASERWSPTIISLWVFFALIPLWFLGGGVAAMSELYGQIHNPPSLYAAELAFDVLSSVFLIFTMITLINTLVAHPLKP